MKIKLLILFVVILLLGVVLGTGRSLYASLWTSHEGEAMIRFEDVGPGQPYVTPQELGKLRAIVDYMYSQHVPFQVAVIPRYISYEGGGKWLDRHIAGSDPESAAFTELLKYMQAHGGTLGMHGYSHQVGMEPRADGWENSGIGREFVVPKVPYTFSPGYAATRIKQSYDLFEKAGLDAAFWESPHYQATYAQEQAFRSFIGLIHEPDYGTLQSMKDVVYTNNENSGFGAPSSGAVYVPTPLSYIDGLHPQNSVNHILTQLNRFTGLAGFFYHPYLEFPFLEPVTVDGRQVIRDGLPEYRYRPGNNSYLHQLVNGFHAHDYRFVSLHDVVPFTPAYRFTLPKQAGQPILEDVDGDGRADIVQYQPRSGRVTLTLNHRAPWRNSPQNASVYAGDTGVQGAVVLPVNSSDRQPASLILFSRTTGEWYSSSYNGSTFSKAVPLSKTPDMLPRTQKQVPLLLAIDTASGNQRQMIPCVVNSQAGSIACQQKEKTLIQESDALQGDIQLTAVHGQVPALVVYHRSSGQTDLLKLSGNTFSVQQIGTLPVHGLLAAGDFSGGKDMDLVLYVPESGKWYLYDAKHGWRNPVSFGPWMKGNEAALESGDIDGNGVTDVAAIRETTDSYVMDTAFGFARP